jgi:hypothetical protein
MGRMRTIKPEFFQHEKLFEAEQASGLPLRLAFAGVWTQCDREGRFEWRPLRLKANIMPWDNLDFGAVLTALADGGFILRYSFGDKTVGTIPSWNKHQRPHANETDSAWPPPPSTPASSNGASPSSNGASANHQGDKHFAKDSLRKDSLRKEETAAQFARSCEDAASGPASSSSLEGKNEDASDPAVLTFPCVGTGAKTWALRESKLAEYRESYPGLDALAECKKALQWARDNPRKRKTAGGMAAFLTKWLNKAQNAPGYPSTFARPAEPAAVADAILKRQQARTAGNTANPQK